MKVYTKKGDRGKTFCCKEVSKDNAIVIALDKIDLLQSAIYSAVMHAKGKTKSFLKNVQKKLTQTAGEIAVVKVVSPVNEKDLKSLEKFIDSLGSPPKKFLRFSTKKAIELNECRVRCRDFEISLVKLLKSKKIRPVVYKYINRLSSLFFMLAYKERRHFLPP